MWLDLPALRCDLACQLYDVTWPASCKMWLGLPAVRCDLDSLAVRCDLDSLAARLNLDSLMWDLDYLRPDCFECLWKLETKMWCKWFINYELNYYCMSSWFFCIVIQCNKLLWNSGSLNHIPAFRILPALTDPVWLRGRSRWAKLKKASWGLNK